MPGGTLYVVATPIGNLEDLAPRAREALGRSDAVACEDTRRTRALLTHLGLRSRLISCHRFNEEDRVPEILDLLGRGGSVALVTDGGTPGISDPGAILVRAARAAGHRVAVIPGPSAVAALLSACGLPVAGFVFVGFLPSRRGERRRAIEALRGEPRPLVLFEGPHRLTACLEDLLSILGDRDICIGREMTKIHEEFVTGRLSTVIPAFAGRAIRGEIAMVVAGLAGHEVPDAAGTAPSPSDLAAAVRSLTRAGVERKEAMRRVARRHGVPRREVYRALPGEESEDPT